MYKVILVEDETLLRRGLLMTTPWQQLDMEVVGEAATGAEGLALIERVAPDIVMTDIKMPGMDGLSMIRAAGPEGAGAYIVLTGFGEFQLAREALQLGVCDYLLKPVDDEELVAALRRAAQRADRRKLHEQMVEQAGTRLEEFELRAQHMGGDQYVEAAVRIIHEQYAMPLTLREVAQTLHVSESHLSHLFQKHTAFSFVEFLTFYRVKRAIALLQDPSIRVYEVADLVGYRDFRYFSQTFKKIVGVTPSEYREGKRA